jgi:hypothetical protein
MAQIAVLAAATAAGNSSDIVVGTQPVKISLYSTATGQAYGTDVKFPLYEKVPGGAYQTYYGKRTHVDEDQPVFLNQQHRSFLITAPGTYRISKAVTVNTVGAFTEDGT